MSRARRADAETAELARRRLQAVLRPRRAASSPPADPAGLTDDLELDDGVDDVWDDDDLRVDEQRRTVVESGPSSTGARLAARARGFTRGHLGVVLVLAVLGLLVAAAGVARARPLAVTEPAPAGVTVSSAPVATSSSPSAGGSASSASPTPTGIVVHVVGEVRRPGVVRLTSAARVADAIAAAGGLSSRAAPGELNLAQPLLDGQQVLIVSRSATQRDPPARSEVRDPGGAAGGEPGASGTTAGARPSTSGAKVNLNTATAAQLDTLSGVGPVTAQRILDWRSAHGRFSRIEELQEVDGIGPKTFAELAPQVTV